MNNEHSALVIITSPSPPPPPPPSERAMLFIMMAITFSWILRIRMRSGCWKKTWLLTRVQSSSLTSSSSSFDICTGNKDRILLKATHLKQP